MSTKKKKVSARRQVKRPAFWLVWRENGGTPTYRHDSEASARAEAERLARQCYGTRFFVLPARDYAIAAITPVAWQTADGLNAKERRAVKRATPDDSLEVPF